ncbi:hypothetical protein FHS27_002227 [Rhodopirellula rubra]|uniref:Uncharacterized protein n=1 Tax=Aporhodopirellula rubra TaxID=980271 RepID=A0A7W5DXL9_9BACT|nr:hypothetical protein [Aporhodopirellula rubra]MBB3206418.1 hypothetical protein [Aporhodopirellula rubra]
MTLTSTVPSPRKRSKKAAKAAATPDFGGPLSSVQWETLRGQLAKAAPRGRSAAKLYGDDGANGAFYLWGTSTAMRGPSTTLQRTLAKLATQIEGDGGASGLARQVDSDANGGNLADADHADAEQEMLVEEAQRLIDRVFYDEMSAVDAAETIMWAAAMPGLSGILPHEVWWQCGEQLLQIRADASLRSDATSPLHLLLAGELGLTLAWSLAALPSCQKLAEPAAEAVLAFIEGEAESIDRSLIHPADLRLIVASLVRCDRLLPLVSKTKFKKRNRDIAAEFATWMAALSRCDGTQALTTVDADECQIDFRSSQPLAGASMNAVREAVPGVAKTKRAALAKKKLGEPDLHGLMLAASEFDRETLPPAMAAALGQSHSGGQLAWEVSLPEAMWHSETGKTLAMLPEWDVRRGRTFVDYSGEDVRVEMMGGRQSIFQGTHQTMVRVGGVDLQPTGDWECTCEYTDDDVHLIELEQPFGDYVLQRQWMLVRDDRCLMISDAVLPLAGGSAASASKKKNGVAEDAPEILCVSRLPLAPGVDVVEDEETRELLFTCKKKRRALVMPLAANEWRVGRSDCQATVSDDQHLVVTTVGRGAVYSPVWIDFQTGRFRRKRTWRQLTVAEELSIIPREVAAGFRVQVGSEHWVVYRSMSGRGPRSVMGKHLIADFFAARFHPGDGGMEELVTVDATSDPE